LELGRRHREARRPWPPWIFIHDKDIVDKGLIVIFLGLFCYFGLFFVSPTPGNFSDDTLALEYSFYPKFIGIGQKRKLDLTDSSANFQP